MEPVLSSKGKWLTQSKASAKSAKVAVLTGRQEIVLPQTYKEGTLQDAPKTLFMMLVIPMDFRIPEQYRSFILEIALKIAFLCKEESCRFQAAMEEEGVSFCQRGVRFPRNAKSKVIRTS